MCRAGAGAATGTHRAPPPMALLPLTAEAQADDHVADQSDANETDQSDRQLLHPGQDICTPAIAKSLLSYVVNR